MEKFNTVINKPLVIIKSLLDENKSLLEKLNEVGDYIKTIIDDDIEKIPYLNEKTLDQIAPYSLVRYRGMVQDMFDPEFYLAKYHVKDLQTNDMELRYGCFTDTGCEMDAREIDFDAPGNVTMERQTFYCTPIPGENEWVKAHYNGEELNINGKICNDSSKMKRKLHEVEDEEMTAPDESNSHTNHSLNTQGADKKLKSATDRAAGTNEEVKEKPVSKVDYAKNFPLPTETGKPCFMKMYSKSSDFKLNDVAEFVCVLSVDPHFAGVSMNSDSIENNDMVTWHRFNEVEDLAHCPPPSLVPRLHCLYFEKLNESNPSVRSKDESYVNASKELTSIRSDFLQLLTQVFGGDNLAAEYLLLHLISTVYGRVGTMCVGNFSMNICKCPKEGKFIEDLYKLISLVVEKSLYFPMSIDNLNNKKFVPVKDFEANRLTAGMLQLSKGTNLVLDETMMEPGRLDPDGVKNLTALGNLIMWQKLQYDFKYNHVDVETNVNVLVLSEGKSLLKCNCKIPICGSAHLAAGSDLSSLSQKLVERIRLYLSIVRSLDYKLTDEAQNALEEDFVEMRKQDSKSMTADSFFNLLTTAKYMALSYGQTTLSAALWTRVKELNSTAARRV